MLTLLLVLCLRFVSGPISDPGVEDRMLAAGRHGDDRAAANMHAQPFQSARNESKSAHDTMEPPALPTMVSAEIGPAGQE
jgi:hypothetical protein